MKKAAALLLISCVMVIMVACSAVGGASTDSAVPSGGVSPVEPADATASSAPEAPAEADYYSDVFDVSADAGKLTARYLYMTLDERAGEDCITTGDSSVYVSPEGLVMLVDCSNGIAVDETIAQLKDMDIEKLDIFVASHPHADHIGGFVKLADTFPIEQIYMNREVYSTARYRNMMTAIEEKNIPVTYLAQGDSFDFGNDVQVQIYNPPADYTYESLSGGHGDANDGSIAMRLQYGESSFWTSGDLYITAEKRLIEDYGDALKSDIIKMNHHGWSTSNDKTWIAALQPKVAVAMHDSITSNTVALRHKVADSTVFYNCIDGAVRISTTGDGTYDIQSQLVRENTLYGEPSADGHYIIS